MGCLWLQVWAAVETLHRCGHIDVPDIPARAYEDKAGLTHMIVGSTGCVSSFPFLLLLLRCIRANREPAACRGRQPL